MLQWMMISDWSKGTFLVSDWFASFKGMTMTEKVIVL